MISIVYSASLWGVDSFRIQIEVDISPGLPQIIIVGLPDQAVKESKERVKSAIKNSGFPFPSKKIVINLAPADIKKEGPSFDLPIALGILASLGHIRPESLASCAFLGELALDGKLRHTKGILAAGLSLKDSGRSLVIPAANEIEGGLIPQVMTYGAKNLREVAEHLNGERSLVRIASPATNEDGSEQNYPFDFHEVKGQLFAKRALEIAVSGGHNVLMVGPPGSGKSMLARRVPSILPLLGLEEKIELTKIYSAAGLLGDGFSLINRRPFRAPHYTISSAGLIGGGSFPKPGEISLSHHGVLFLDELPEFRQGTLETLRGPLEDGLVQIGRAKATLSFPARFMLLAAMNPCRCGFLGDPKKNCQCSLGQVLNYRSKLSGPLLDRIDLHIEVPAITFSELIQTRPAESSKMIRARIEKVRGIQKERFQTETLNTNSSMGEKELKRYCHLDEKAQKLLKAAVNELGFSARAYARILKVGRTLADMAGSKSISEEHIAEAVQYRTLDRKFA